MAVEIASRRVTVVELGVRPAAPSSSAMPASRCRTARSRPALTGREHRATPASVAEVLRRALERAGVRGAGRAALVVPDSVARVTLLPFEQMPAKAADLDQLVRWQLKKATPFPIEEAQVSSFVAHRTETGPTIAAVVARRDVIAQYRGGRRRRPACTRASWTWRASTS